MSRPRWGVQNRPTATAVQGALYGFLISATLAGGFVGAIVADRARVWRNARRLAKRAAS